MKETQSTGAARPKRQSPSDGTAIRRVDLLREPQCKPFYIIGEKILMRNEPHAGRLARLQHDGLCFLNALNGIFIDGANARLSTGYTRDLRGSKVNYHHLGYEKKKLIMMRAMSSEINTLGNYLNHRREEPPYPRLYPVQPDRHHVEVIACLSRVQDLHQQ